MLVRDAQLIGGADHGIAGHPANLARLELLEYLFTGMAVEQDRAGEGRQDRRRS